jgi:hypothetical protein
MQRKPALALIVARALTLIMAVLPMATVFAEEPAAAQTPRIDAAIPGGNIVVETIDGDVVHLHQDERDTPRFWFHWNFRIRSAAGRAMVFEFTKGNVFGTRGPAISRDAGRSWSWLGREAVRGDSFTHRFDPGDDDVRFAFAIPYTQANLQRFLEQHARQPGLRRETLTRSPHGRPVELLRAGRLEGNAPHRIVIVCRHHACESVANFTLEGVLEAIVEDTPAGRWWRENVELLAVPFVDKDGVEEGDQGKLRAPHDHWLDYESESRHPSVRELRKRFDAPPQRAVDVSLDLHCPYIRDEKIYFAGGADPRIAGETDRFCRLLEQRQSGPLPYRRADNLPFGKGWNTAATYAGRRAFWQWAETLPGMRVAATIEIPYASVGETTVDPVSARAFGHDLTMALRDFLEGKPRP